MNRTLLLACLIAPGLASTPALAIVISNVQIDVGTHAAIATGQQVTVTFDYELGGAGPVWVLPWFAGALHPSAAYQSSGSVSGAGTLTRWFRIDDASPPLVNELVIAVGSSGAHQFHIPVHLQVGDAGVYDIEFGPGNHSCLKYGNSLEVSFAYAASEPVRIFARPFTGSALTPGYGGSGSPTYAAGTGTGSNSFTVFSGPVDVDHVRLQVQSTDDELLAEVFVPVDLSFQAAQIANITPALSSPNSLEHHEQLHVSFSCDADEPFRVWAQGLVQGVYAPSQLYLSSVVETGPGIRSRWFTITDGAVTVDEIEVRMMNADQTTILARTRIPVNFHWEFDRILSHAFDPPRPACLTHGERVDVSLFFDNNRTEDHIVFARPFIDGELAPGYSASPGEIVSPGASTIAQWFTLSGDPAIVDEIRVQMWNLAQTALRFEWFIPVEFHYGANPVVGIDEIEPASASARPRLAQNVPNPFNPRTTIAYELPARAQVVVDVFDVAGRRVRRLVHGEERGAGTHEVEFDGTGLASGPYFYRLQADGAGGQDFTEERKMLLVK